MRITQAESLGRRLHRLERAAGVTFPPRTWVLYLDEGEAIPAHVQAAVNEQDTIYVHHIVGVSGYIERLGNWTYGYCYWKAGAMIVYPDHVGKPYRT